MRKYTKKQIKVEKPTYSKERAILHFEFLPMDMLHELGKLINKEQYLYDIDDLVYIHSKYVQAVVRIRDERIKSQ